MILLNYKCVNCEDNYHPNELDSEGFCVGCSDEILFDTAVNELVESETASMYCYKCQMVNVKWLTAIGCLHCYSNDYLVPYKKQ